MNTKISPAVVGAFVIGAFALGIVAVVTFGSLSLFTKPERFLVYFNESVHGLDVGSAVKLGGVRVGRIVDLSIRYDRDTNQSVAVAECELDHDRIADRSGAVLDVSDREVLQGLVDHGLRAQLDFAGFATGLLFVELDFVDPHQYPDLNHVSEIKYVIVPSIPSEISEFRAHVSKLLASVQQIDFKQLSIDLDKLLVTTRQKLDGLDLKGLMAQWQKTGASVDALARSPEFGRTLANLNLTLEALRASLAKVDANVDGDGKALKDALAQAREALAAFNSTAVAARRFIDAQQNLGADADNALGKLAEAAEAVQRLADFLERNPNSVISGKKEPQ
jgi:paraquat-inducible protein B